MDYISLSFYPFACNAPKFNCRTVFTSFSNHDYILKSECIYIKYKLNRRFRYFGRTAYTAGFSRESPVQHHGIIRNLRKGNILPIASIS